MSDTTPMRERIAREIDHEGYWERLDNLNAVIRAGIASSDDQHMELCHVRDEERAGTEDSLELADRILAILTPADTAGLIEQARRTAYPFAQAEIWTPSAPVLHSPPPLLARNATTKGGSDGESCLRSAR